jgi:transcriptional regulator with XRE-family HTH domain
MDTDVQPYELNGRFRENLRRRREALGLTQEQVAAKIGAHGPYISDIETGKKVPILGTLARLAEALKTTPAALIS